MVGLRIKRGIAEQLCPAGYGQTIYVSLTERALD